MYNLFFLSAVLLLLLVGGLAHSLFSKWREVKADDFAIKNSSDEELKGGRRFFIFAQKILIQGTQTFWNRFDL